MLTTVLFSVLTMLVLALAAGWLLGWANVFFHVPVDPKVEAIIGKLPGANCGGCGFVGCAEYAAAVAAKKAAVDLCAPGGKGSAHALAGIMGTDVKESFPYRPVVHCAATYAARLLRAPYRGERSCAAANLVAGFQGCTYGCLGEGDCTRACNYGAMQMRDGLPVFDYEKCIGCKACARACPRQIITMVPFKADRILVVACSNQDQGLAVKDVCTVGCIGCKACAKASPGVIGFAHNLPSIDYLKYDPATSDVQAALAKCPRESLVFVGKPTPADRATAAKEKVPARVVADFKTTADQTEWRG